MDFRDFLPEEEETESDLKESEVSENIEKIDQTQFYDIITSQKPDWQAIIYDLIHSEQLDPWDIDIVLLTGKYFEKIIELEEKAVSEGIEEIDFYISSKVLFAAALLLRIKSEFLLNKHIRSIDELLFGKKEEHKQIMERIEIDEDELPILIPKTPLPRLRRVTLNELMSALNKAINTESRRIKREVAIKRAKKLSEVDIPKFRRIDLKDRIKQFYAKIFTSIKKLASKTDKSLNKVGYSNLVGKEREERLACFLPLLHLSNTQKLWLEQEFHLDEIWIYLYEYFNKNRDEFIEELEEDIEEMKEELRIASSELASSESFDSETSKNPGLEKARIKREEKNKLEEEVRKELIEELGKNIENEINDIQKEQKIEEASGFEEE